MEATINSWLPGAKMPFLVMQAVNGFGARNIMLQIIELFFPSNKTLTGSRKCYHCRVLLRLSELLFAFQWALRYIVIKYFFHRCISLHIMINHEVSGYIMKDPEGDWSFTTLVNTNNISWLIVTYRNRLWESPSEFHEKSWPVMILHHNISERQAVWSQSRFSIIRGQLVLRIGPKIWNW